MHLRNCRFFLQSTATSSGATSTARRCVRRDALFISGTFELCLNSWNFYAPQGKEPSNERWVFSSTFNPSPPDGKPRGVASTRTGNGAVPTGHHRWRGKAPPPTDAESEHAAGSLDLSVHELFRKPGETTTLSVHFLYRNDHFTKTRSGQT